MRRPKDGPADPSAVAGPSVAHPHPGAYFADDGNPAPVPPRHGDLCCRHPPARFVPAFPSGGNVRSRFRTGCPGPGHPRIGVAGAVGLGEREDGGPTSGQGRRRGRRHRRRPGGAGPAGGGDDHLLPARHLPHHPDPRLPAGRFPGVTLIGHGRSTVLAWDGEAGGRMFWTNEGMLYSRYVGLTWDGRGKAAVGFDHSAQKIFETEIRHEHEAYRNFTEAGIRAGWDKKVATAETHYDNCLFEHCGHGVSLHGFNVLDHTFDGCEFRRLRRRRVRRQGDQPLRPRLPLRAAAREADVVCRGEQGSSVRRCTSQRLEGVPRASAVPSARSSSRTARSRGGRTRRGGRAGRGAGAGVRLRLHPPAGGAEAPVRTGRAGQRLIVSNNRADGCKAVVRTPAGGQGGRGPGRRARRGRYGRRAGGSCEGGVRSPARCSTPSATSAPRATARPTTPTRSTRRSTPPAPTAAARSPTCPPGRYVDHRHARRSRGSDYVFGGSGFRRRPGLEGPGRRHHARRSTTRPTHGREHRRRPPRRRRGDNAVDILQSGGRQALVHPLRPRLGLGHVPEEAAGARPAAGRTSGRRTASTSAR